MNSIKYIKGTGLLFAFLAYFLSNILIFFVHGIFWDDWTLANSPIGIMEQFVGNGGMASGYMHLLLHMYPNDILIYHTLIFCLGLLDIVLVYYICNLIWKKESFTVVCCILYACFPLGMSHMTQICFPYQIGYTCQFVAIWAFLRIRTTSTHFVMYSILIFLSQFLAALFLNSSIVFWFGVLSVGCIVDIFEKKDIGTRLSLFIRCFPQYALFFMPCLIYWVLRNLFWMPTGSYAEYSYNEFSLKHILYYPFKLILSGINTITYILKLPIVLFNSSYYLVAFGIFTILMYILFSLYCKHIFTSCNIQRKTIITRILLGAYLYIMGISAYILVGKVQVFNSLEDRHGIFLIPTIVLIISTLIELLRDSRLKICIMSFMVSLFIINSISQYTRGIRESVKNDYLVAYFSNADIPQGNIQIYGMENDDLMRFYTLSGIYRKATNKQDRCFSLSDGKIFSEKSNLIEMFHQKEARQGPIVCTLSFKENATPDYLKLIYFYYFNRSEYYKLLFQKFILYLKSA